MTNPLFIVIAVHKARTLDVLDGVLQSANSIGDWAQRHGYDRIIVTDDSAQPIEQRPVTVDRIKALLPAKVLLGRPRIIVYFCGHGLHAPGDQHWVLSAGPSQRRISAVGFRDALETYGTPQLAIFSDACRTPWVEGASVDNVIDNYPSEFEGADKDKFYSTRAGQASYAIPARNGGPAYCVFSRTLMEALDAPEPRTEFLDEAYLAGRRLVLSSQSLARFLKTAVPLRAPDGDSRQKPQCEGVFVPTDNIYREWPSDSAVIADDGTHRGLLPAARSLDLRAISLHGETLTRELSEERHNLSRSEWRGPFMEQAVQALEQQPWPEYFTRVYIDPGRTSAEDVEIDVIGAPALYPSLVASDQRTYGLGLQSPREPSWSFIWRHGDRLRGAALGPKHWSFIVRAGDLFAPVVSFKGLWAVLAFRQRPRNPNPDEQDTPHGLDLLNWNPSNGEPINNHRNTVEALKGLTLGVLTVEDVWRLATALRWDKHANPMLGIVAAYLYNNVGDIDAIRRMSAFYAEHRQDLPFDIALLARVPLRRNKEGFLVNMPGVSEIAKDKRPVGAPSFTWQSTKGSEQSVAGATPLLPAGWRLLHNSKYRIHKRCAEILSSLTNSAISTFAGKENGKVLREAFEEFRSGK